MLVSCGGEGRTSSTSVANPISSVTVSSPATVSSAASSADADNGSSSSVSTQEALTFYRESVEQPVTQSRCVVCHVQGGPSGNTRLVFVAGGNQADSNFAVLEQYLTMVPASDNLILSKVRGGDSHGGGSILSSSSDEFADLRHALELITGNTLSVVTPSAMFSKVQLADTQTTLRRAALLLAERLPTEEEVALADNEPGLRVALQSLMEGQGFKNFLLRGANDRLLTRAFRQGLNLDVIDPNSPIYPTLAGIFVDYNRADMRNDFYSNFHPRLTHGVANAPLELIAYVVQNNLPYTETLTANYTMANPQLATIYNVDVNALFDSDDYNQFAPVVNRGQVLRNPQLQVEFVEGIGSIVSNHGGFVEYPHAGILNEPAFLNRYPSTDTNRNRARARWAYYHFLGFDIEKSAARTTNPDALADTNNPTMNNLNCTVCHITMDPVAGAFQNYGDEGNYRNSWGGLDALPWPYKNGDLYQSGDTWYRDMRLPGFNDALAPDNRNSLQWLAQQIVADDRFATAAIKFWWPALMAEDHLEAPENSQDADYEAKLAAFDAQNTFIEELGAAFRAGIEGGTPYNLKAVLIEMVLSPWFRASSFDGSVAATEAISETDQQRLAGVGVGRLLTPEELEAKTSALIGYAWGESDAPWLLDNTYTNLLDRYLIYYGGMDSVGITERARELNTLMSNVALTQAVSVSCGAVVMDFNRQPMPNLFTEITRLDTPISHDAVMQGVTGLDGVATSRHTLQTYLPAGEQAVSVHFVNPYWDADLQVGTQLLIARILVQASGGQTLLDINGEDLADQPGFVVSTNSNGGNTGGANYDQSLGRRDGYRLWSGAIVLPLTVANAGNFTVTVEAWRQNLPDYPVNMAVVTQGPQDSLYSNHRGEQRIRAQLVKLHQLFLGQTLATDDPEIDASYNMLVDTWQWRQQNTIRRAYDWSSEGCDLPIPNWWQLDMTSEFADPSHMQGSWIGLLIYLMTDYHYLHE